MPPSIEARALATIAPSRSALRKWTDGRERLTGIELVLVLQCTTNGLGVFPSQQLVHRH
jgi:hypothetical protein